MQKKLANLGIYRKEPPSISKLIFLKCFLGTEFGLKDMMELEAVSILMIVAERESLLLRIINFTLA